MRQHLRTVHLCDEQWSIVTVSIEFYTVDTKLAEMALLPTQTKLAKVMFLHVSVILSTGGGVCLSACWDAHTPSSRHPQ